MSEAVKTKEQLLPEFERVKRLTQVLGQKLDAAKASGNNDEYQSLLEDKKKLKSIENNLQNQWSSITEKEKQPEIERISALRKELEGSTAPTGTPYGYAYTQPTLEEEKARQRELIGKIYNAPPSEGGMPSEQLPAGVRFGVGALATPESELEYLKRTYPDANITPMSVGNSTEFLIKTKDNKTFTTLDMGLAGFGGAALVEAPIVAGSTAAGITAALATKSPVAGTATAAGTEAVLGTTADMITRAALGMPQTASTTGEIAMRRGTQAAIGGGLGAVGDIAIPRMTVFRAPAGASNEFLQEFAGPSQRTGIPMPPGVQFGPRGLMGAQELAGDFPTSRLGGQFRTGQLDLLQPFQEIKDFAQRSTGDYASVAFNQAQQRRALTTRIAQNTNQNEQIVEGAVNRLLQPSGKSNIDTLGKTLRESVLAAEEKVIKDKNQKYDDVLDLADQAGFSMSAKDLFNTVESMAASINRSNALNDSAIVGTMNKLKERVEAPAKLKFFQKYVDNRLRRGLSISEEETKKLDRLKNLARPIDSKDFEDYIKGFREARPDDPRAGTSKDVFGTQIASKLSEYRRNVYSSLNANLPNGTTVNVGDLFRDASEEVSKSKAFQENLLGSILKEAGGEQSNSPRVIANAVMKDPFNMERVLQAARNLEATDPTKAGITKNIQEMMQNQYLDEMKVTSRGNLSQLNYDKGKLDVLFGPDAGKIARGLDTLNDKLKTIKGVSLSDFNRNDLMTLSSALAKSERKALADQIIKREQTKKLEEELAASEIFKAAKNGQFDNIDPDVLSAAVFSGTKPRDVEIAMAQLNKVSPDARNMYKSDFARSILDRYKGGERTTAQPFAELFDVNKFLSDYGTPTKPTELGRKINTVLGNDMATRIYDIAKLYQGYGIREASQKDLNARIVASSKAVNVLLPIAKLTTYARNRLLAEGLANSSGSNRLRAALARNAMPGDVNDAYMEMFKSAFKTRQGLTSLMRQASGDPEFSAELQQAVKDFEEQEQAGFNARSAKLMEGANQSQQKQNLNPAPR